MTKKMSKKPRKALPKSNLDKGIKDGCDYFFGHLIGRGVFKEMTKQVIHNIIEEKERIAKEQGRKEILEEVLKWIDNCRKSNDMWRYDVDVVFGKLETELEQKLKEVKNG